MRADLTETSPPHTHTFHVAEPLAQSQRPRIIPVCCAVSPSATAGYPFSAVYYDAARFHHRCYGSGSEADSLG